MRKNFVKIASVCAALIFVSACATVIRQPSIQELIMQGRYDEAKEIFKTKTDINACDENGDTALHVAARVNEADLVSFLIIKGADTEVQNKEGDTALHVAIKNDAIDAAKVLAIVHGDIFAKDAEENTALELALAKGEEWYDAMITSQTGKIRDVDGESIVHYFVKTRDELAIDRCIQVGVPLSVRDNYGFTPLDLAFKSAENSASIRIAARLLLAGATPVRGDFAYFEDAVRTHNMILRFNDGQTPLHIATIDGHTGIVDYILKEHTAVRIADILSAQDISGATPLHEAVRYGRVDIARLLLASGANVNAMDSIGKTPILLIIPSAAQQNMYPLLLVHKANVNQKDMYGDTVLHVATMANVPVNTLSLLVSNGASVNERNKEGVTPLALAIETMHPEQVKFYSKSGADIYAEDMKGNTPLTKALESDSRKMLETLITGSNIAATDSSGNTALHIAIEKDAPLDYIRYLVDAGSDVNARNKNGDSVLFVTVQKNRRDAGDLLLEKNADIFATNTQNDSPLRLALTQGGEVQDWLITSKTLNSTDGSGNTPLHYAAEWHLNGAIIALIQKGAKVDAVNGNGESAIYSAVRGGDDSPSTINVLVSNGLVIDSRNKLGRDNLGNTPLHAAVKWNGFNNAKTLVALGVDVDAQNLSGKTALSDACRSAKKDMAILLIRSGADINATDATGRTVLMDAISSSNEDMVRLLLQYKANVQVQEMSGQNAYHEAAVTGNIGIINMIRKAGGNPLSRDAAGETPFSLVLGAEISVIQAVLGNDTTISDSDGNTPIHIAVQKHASQKTLMQLLNIGYPASQRNGQGLTPLNEAVANNEKNQALVLLEYGADPYLSTTSGENALTAVFKTKNLELLDAIAKYNATRSDRQGDGILHYAARFADKEIVEHLVSLKLDKSVRNISGETPAQMAERWGRKDIAEILR
ncbi:ankyrin repeat domain-containing protein [Treponema sp.]|uniref:ankyrin repeat domain-containing protein n=1 Tax=Treponema sp. TaxID=166 RepID=UPI0025E2C11A|nr:ankyrin repeat domain-containing protein [Treponema sp.]MBR4322330.1 ankyrin repeat domain-containing protein [Treponema sp.]